MLRLGLSLLLLLLLAPGCSPATRSLAVVHSTDVHGAFGTSRSAGARGFAALLDRLEREGREVLVLDSGDMWSGTLLSDRSEGALGLALYDALGVHAAALGNHEFDYGPVGFEWRTEDDPSSALRARLREARFPILAANLLDPATGRFPDWDGLAPSTVLTVAGIRVGVVGAITPVTPDITFPWVGEQLTFLPPAGPVADEARRLRAEGAELVFVVGHLGGDCAELGDPDDLSSCDEQSEAFALARALPSGLVDAVFGGHTHQRVGHRPNGLPVLHGDCWFREAARLDVTLRRGAPPVLEVLPPASLVDEGEGPRRAAVDALLRPAEAEVESLRAAASGLVLVESLGHSRTQSSALGSFLCDELLALHPAADVCILNSGGLRAELPAGPVPYGAVYDTLPFGNAAALITLDGARLRSLLRLGVSGAHGVPQVAGLSLTYDLSADACPGVDRDGDGDIDLADRARLGPVRLGDGSALEPEATYTVVTNSFLASGGDGWRPLLEGLPTGAIEFLHRQGPLREQLTEAWRGSGGAVSAAGPAWDSRVVPLGQPPAGRCSE